jgi:hypothetical protein
LISKRADLFGSIAGICKPRFDRYAIQSTLYRQADKVVENLYVKEKYALSMLDYMSE